MTLSTSTPLRAQHRGHGSHPGRHAETLLMWFEAAALPAQKLAPTSPNEAALPTVSPPMACGSVRGK